MATDHSQLPPSGAEAWLQCSAWPSMNRKYPQLDIEDAEEGTASHWAGGELIAGRVVAEGQIAPNNVILDAEMIEGAELYADTVAVLLPPEQFGPPRVEMQVAIPAIHTSCFGTPDTWGFDPQRVLLRIVDYKFGHRFVDEFENQQCIAYAAGIIEEIAKLRELNLDRLWQHITVEITIVQPRCYYRGAPVRTWTAKGPEIKKHVTRLAEAAIKALNRPTEATTGEACRDCTGRAHCPALQKAAYSDAEFAVKSSPHELPPAAAALELRMLQHALKRLEARTKGLEAAVIAHAQAGHPVPHYAIERSYGRQEWTQPADVVIALGAVLGVNLAKPPQAITPGQAAKLGIDDAVITAYSAKQPGGVKLVPAKSSDARRVFGQP